MRNQYFQVGGKKGAGVFAILVLLTAFTSPFELTSAQGINTTGINADGINSQGIHSEGIKTQGINGQGIDSKGIQSQGIHSEGVTPQGINQEGINRQEINPQGINSQGINPKGINPQGTQSTGITGQGIQNNGIQTGGNGPSVTPGKSPSTPEPKKPEPSQPVPPKPEPKKPEPPKTEQPKPELKNPEPKKPEPPKSETPTPPKKDDKKSTNRTKENYQKVLDMEKFDVSKHYLPDQYTYCNIFSRHVMKEMGAYLPEKLANDLYGWLQGKEAKNKGWREVTAEEAQRLANEGFPTIASWKNNNGYHGHIAPVIPYAKGETFNPKDVAASVVVKNAGASNYNYTTLEQAFGRKRVPEIKFFVNE
ncbi:hypothetical protein NDK47_26830 [Brevibacillus ruminantium]|uniref:Peptidase C51 domain-containing protein n=1 Tax=Brevibacillus ruminantium TaxID=2950604 RepID=A0ABY4WEU5_9BACL|nr:hypothetical protein [Brevibacillus ruminantium]USG65670.1 hypothetical protein NDK47_26830 [Brevibacillus ruminantium]